MSLAPSVRDPLGHQGAMPTLYKSCPRAGLAISDPKLRGR